MAAHLVALYLLSTISTPLYTLYQSAFGFSRTMLTVIYAVYVVGAIGAMFFLGRLSDQIGRRPVVLVSAACAFCGTIVFLVATSTAWLFPARVLTGFAVALVTGATTAWLVELDPRGDAASGTRLAIVANMLGLGLGPVLAGALARWAPWPLRLSYVAFLVVLVPLAICNVGARETVEDRRPLREVSLRPRLGVPKEIRARFAPAALGGFAMFSVLGFYAALVPTLLHATMRVRSVFVGGVLVGEAFVVGAITVALLPKIDTRRTLVGALALLVPSVGMLVVAQLAVSVAVLAIGTAITGVAGGLGYRACLQTVNEIAPEDRRSEVVSTFVMVCYLGISIPVIGVGLLAGATSLTIAVSSFAALVAAIAIVALVIEIVVTRGHRRSSTRSRSSLRLSRA